MSTDQQSGLSPDVIVQVEREKTKRWLIVSVAISVWLAILCWTFLRFSAIERPWWHYVLAPVVPILSQARRREFSCCSGSASTSKGTTDVW